MLRFRNLSLGRKLTRMNLVVASAALLLVCGTLMTRDVMSYRRDLVNQASVYAQMVGSNSGPDWHEDEQTAAARALVLLKPAKAVHAAALYAPGGKTFATYSTRDDGVPFPDALPKEGDHRFTADYLETWHRVEDNGQWTSTVYLRSSLDGLYTRITWYAAILGFAFVDAILAALILSRRLQRAVSDPILHLAETARAVTTARNYSVRAVKRSDDELGQLTDGFNEMLEQIRKRDEELQAHRDSLEEEVARRTQQLIELNF